MKMLSTINQWSVAGKQANKEVEQTEYDLIFLVSIFLLNTLWLII